MEIYFNPQRYTGTRQFVEETIEEVFERSKKLSGLLYENNCFIIIIEDTNLTDIIEEIAKNVREISKEIGARAVQYSVPDFNFSEILYY